MLLKSLVRIVVSGLCIASLASCGGRTAKSFVVRVAHPRTPVVRSAADGDWRRVATPADRVRLRAWRQAWIDALAKVKGGTRAATIAADATLFDPDRALGTARPPAGAYRCRVFKLGANGTAMRDVTVYPAVACTVDDRGAVSSLAGVSGAQRPVGTIFPDTPARSMFLGTMVLGDETRPRAYGRDANRDLAGYVERIGERRWRLVLPYPRFESLLDVVEIVPAPRR